ncbi:MAG: S4 domain-containing protein [Novosphingobium sp.]|nr:S4 domain-containing protein [Novosphingobium sp.]
MRIDKLLWLLRFAKTRGAAQKWVGEGHIRRNGKRVERMGQATAIGDVLTLPLRSRVMVIELLALPERRGPPDEARKCYRVLDGGDNFAIAGQRIEPPEGPDRDYRP